LSTPKKYVDGILVDYGHKLFYDESISIKPRRNKVAKPKKSKTSFGPFFSPAKIRAQIERTVDRTPEVMVKISSKKDAGRGMLRIDAHLDYITRNGKLEIEVDDGDILYGTQALKDIKAEWRMNPNGTQIPEVSDRREAFNVLFSMPVGTPAEDVRDAVREFLTDEFGGKHRYVFVLHTDQKQPHVHVCVQTAPKKRGNRLNPRKKDLQRWREGFAEKLRQRGIAANATSQKTRGTFRQNLSLEQYQMVQAGLLHKPERVLTQADIASYQYQNRAWQKVSEQLNQSADAKDRELAARINAFGKQTPIYQALSKPGVIKPPAVTLTKDQNYDRKHPSHQQRLRRAAAVYQSSVGWTPREPAAKSIDSLRKLSDFNVVRKTGQNPSKLLQSDAHDRLGRKSRTNPKVRR